MRRFTDLALGESIAVDGACLTVQALHRRSVHGPFVRTSLDRTHVRGLRGGSAGQPGAGAAGWATGWAVTWFRAMSMGSGPWRPWPEREDARLLDLQVPEDVGRVSILLGSITVDGVSLTVNAIPGPESSRSR